LYSVSGSAIKFLLYAGIGYLSSKPGDAPLAERQDCTGTFRKRVAQTRRPRNATKGESLMPVLFIEAPPGIRPEKKRVMMQKITEAIDEAYHIGDTLIFLREYPVENVAMDGRIQSENPKILEALKKISAGAGIVERLRG